MEFVKCLTDSWKTIIQEDEEEEPFQNESNQLNWKEIYSFFKWYACKAEQNNYSIVVIIIIIIIMLIIIIYVAQRIGRQGERKGGKNRQKQKGKIWNHELFIVKNIECTIECIDGSNSGQRSGVSLDCVDEL